MGFLLIGLFFGELLVSLKVGLIIGFGWSVVWILATAALGALLIQLSPYALMQTFNNISLYQFSIQSAHNAALAYLFAAILLIIPGVATDVIGLFLLLYSLYLRLFATMRTHKDQPYYKHKGDDDVIDVEIIDESDSSKPDS